MIKRKAVIHAERLVSQGDVTFKRVPAIPAGYNAVSPSRELPGAYILAHSETGHHHAIDADGVVMYEGADPLRAYLRMETVELVGVHHQRGDADAHCSIALMGGRSSVWEVRRQREYDPAGERRAAD